MEKKWELNKCENAEIATALSELLKVDRVIGELLVNRGVESYEEAKAFFRPDISGLHDPLLMEDMDLAVNRIEKAITEGEKIMVYGDYDVDGTTAVTLVYEFLHSLQCDVLNYQPDRYREGYGVSRVGVEKANELGVSVLITLDCGIKAVEMVKLAKDFGIDVIVCDHHRPGDQLPEAHAILNPKKASCNYPFKELCGVGVGFKLVSALVQSLGLDVDLKQFLDLVAIGTAADIVPLTGENRILTYYGIEEVMKLRRAGVREMLELSNRKHDLTVSDLVFAIAPRINAAGRMFHASKAVELLVSNSGDEVRKTANEIEAYNKERKETDAAITEEALGILSGADVKRFTNVVWSNGWHKGVVGIVASRIIENYYLPTIVFSVNNGVATGSARSIRGFDIHDAIGKCAELLDGFGGHKYAAGLTIQESKLDAFTEMFEKVVADHIDKNLLSPVVRIDAEISVDILKRDRPDQNFPKIFRVSEQLGPFGPGNPKPTFVLRNMTDTGYSRVVGEKHLKLSVRQDGDPLILEGIAFGLGAKLDLIKGRAFDIACTLEKNVYQGHESLQLMVKDIK